jgi:hypothetical protein
LKKHAVLLAMASALSLASSGAFAQTTLLWCNGCTEQQEARASAREVNKGGRKPDDSTQGTIHVGNNKAIHKYSVYMGNQINPSHCEDSTCHRPQRATATTGASGNGNDGPPRWTAIPMPVEPHVQAAFDDMRAFYQISPVD